MARWLPENELIKDFGTSPLAAAETLYRSLHIDNAMLKSVC